MDDLRRIDMNLLLTLHALLTEKHVTRAALRLHRSQPAVSHSLAQLRQIFNDPLLVRREVGLTLTTRAQALLGPLELALEQLNGLIQAPQFDPRHSTRHFRLALSDYGTNAVLPTLMRHLRVQAPGVSLAVSHAGREMMLAQLIDGDIDLGLGVFPERPSEVHAELLFEEQFACLADRATLPENGMLSFEAWLERPHVLVTMHPDSANEVDSALAASGLSRNVVLTLPHWHAAINLIAGTDLILTAARRSMAHITTPNLHIFPPPFAIPNFAFQQVWHTRRESDPAHRWLRRAIWESCQAGEVNIG
ncbi:LysR family transcriptional regulator [Pectobacterium brasiliense]|uniref:LysR family transcriptional regulator n=1 Tax=Pectobacterium brasiliense TaxID=180957 RepID=UPI00057D35E1|nr:LysR family transcriptional regulator [Pectobacterium brasiliense]KHS92503.1 LysR family transcriptional regulator [Pectobacterium brasiliense]MBN3256387.1 LysR family transcriptional regulator [Pectobacterium brasiliense]MBN7765439.1 LysR family transcriptional regulator [Pectobacterium brasiliense]